MPSSFEKASNPKCELSGLMWKENSALHASIDFHIVYVSALEEWQFDSCDWHVISSSWGFRNSLCHTSFVQFEPEILKPTTCDITGTSKLESMKFNQHARRKLRSWSWSERQNF